MSSNPEYADLTEDDISPLPTRPVTSAGMRARPARTVEAEPDQPDEPEAEAVPASRGSLLPIVISALAGLLVIGMLGFSMLTPRGKPPAAQAITLGSGQASATTPSSSGSQESPRPGYLAPDFTLTDLNGGQVKLSSFRGVKPVWVNFWATWCPPCRAEMPEMQKIYEKYKDKGIEFLGVDVQEGNSTVSDFVKNGGFGWNFLLDGDGNVSRKYYVSGIPTHVFIGRDGVIKDLVVSGLSNDMMESELTKLLAQ
jgi:thiol-disulfide isomerase/thioredoxin